MSMTSREFGSGAEGTFQAAHLSREEVAQAYQAALHQLDQQRQIAWINRQIADAAYQERCAQLRRLEAEYDRWQEG